MQTISEVKAIFIFVMLFATSAGVMAADNHAERNRILQAMELYSEALVIDQVSTQRADLLRESEAILLAVIANNPASLDAHRKLMGVYLQMRDYRKGIQTMQTAITLSPEDPKLYIALAILYDHQGAYEYARAILDEALLLDPDQQLAREFRASVQSKIDGQNIAMEASPHPQQPDKPHSMEDRLSR